MLCFIRAEVALVSHLSAHHLDDLESSLLLNHSVTLVSAGLVVRGVRLLTRLGAMGWKNWE
jgi:hypothetical protein